MRNRRHFLSIASALLLVLALWSPGVSADASGLPLSRSELNDVFNADSYWKMTMYGYGTPEEIVGDYWLELTMDCHYATIVNAEADDLRVDKYAWHFDSENAVLQIDMLDDGWDNGTFHFADGMLVCEGSYYRTELTRTPGAKADFTAAATAFHENYGGYNPAARLVTSNAHFRYRDLTEFESLPYESFRYLVNVKGYGFILPMEAETADSIWQELSAVLGSKMAPSMKSNTVYFGVNFPEEYNGFFDAASEADVLNLVFTGHQDAYEAFGALQMNGEVLLPDSPTYKDMTAADLYDGAFFWNDTDAVTIFRIGQSVILFRGPTEEIKLMTRFLDLGVHLWETGYAYVN